jgi:YVTN family beta-propeller protein
MSKRSLALLALTALSLTSLVAAAQKPYHIESRWLVGGEGGWDYLTADASSHRLYLTHTTKVEVVDTNTGKVLGSITGLTRVHGVVLSPDGKTGYISDGGANVVVAFDPSSLKVITRIPAGKNPDGMAYEPVTNTLWAFNGASHDATVIDAQQNKVVGTIPLSGKPEFPQVDRKGTVFVNIEDKNSIVRLDAKTKSATATWPLAGCDSPSGMAIDLSGMRLFSVCDGKKMAVTDAHTGKSLATPSIGDGPDAAGYDAKDKLAFSSNGDGTLTIVNAGKPGYPVLQTLVTEKGARTMTYDPTGDKVYLVTSKFAPADPAKPKARPAPLPGTFTVLVIGR